MVYLGCLEIDLLPGEAALDALINSLLARNGVALEDLVQRDLIGAEPDDLIAYLKKQELSN